MYLRFVAWTVGLFSLMLIIGRFLALRLAESLLLGALFVLLLFEVHEVTEKALARLSKYRGNWPVNAVKSTVILLGLILFAMGCNFLRISLRQPGIMDPELLLGLALISSMVLLVWFVVEASSERTG
jgi:hypothetical protein